MKRPASLAASLPYWTVLPLVGAATPDGDGRDGRTAAVDCLVLKDGTLAIGLRTAALDGSAADAGRLDAHAALWQRALAALPERAYLQTTFRSGGHVGEHAAAFSERSHATSSPLLRHGRAKRAAAIQADRSLRTVDIVHWVGQRRALAGLVQSGSKGALAGNTARFVATCQQFWQSLAPLLAVLRSGGLSPEVLAGKRLIDLLSAGVHHSFAPERPFQLPPTPLFVPADCQGPGPASLTGHYNLDARLATESLHITDTSLYWSERQRFAQAGHLARMGDVSHAALLQGLCFDRAPTEPFTVSVCHEKTAQSLQRERLEQRRKWLFALIGSRFLNHAAKRAYEQVELLLAELAGGGGQLFRTSLTVLTSGATEREAADQMRLARHALEQENMLLGVQRYAQQAGWLATLPGYGYSAERTQLLLDGSCAHLTPNCAPSCGDQESDLLFTNRDRGVHALSIRVGARADASAVIIGKTGSGKTFLFSHLAKYGCLDLGGHVVLADNKGPANSSYRPLCKLLGGSYVHLQADEQVGFNPFPDRAQVLPNGTFDPQSTFVLERILGMMVEDDKASEHSDYVRSILHDAVVALYQGARHHRRPLVLRDALACVRALAPRNDTLRRVAQRIAERLEFWCEDPVRGRLFGTEARLDASNRFSVFDFHGLDRDPALSAVLIASFAGCIEQKMRELPVTVPKVFAFDEAWAMFDASPAAAALMNRLYRTARSFGAVCYILTQDSRDISGSGAASGVLSNLALTFLMRHQDGHQEAAKLFQMNERQLELFRSLKLEPGRYGEFLLLDGNAETGHVLRYAPLAFDLWCDSSRPLDVSLRAAAINQSDQSDAELPEIIDCLANVAPRGAPTDPGHQQRVLREVQQRLSARSGASVACEGAC